MLALALALAAAPAPPGPPPSGYGSSDAYVAQTWEVVTTGSARRGTKVWTYVPDVLRDGRTAPVVVYLHGWTALDPAFYISHIEHLARQGILVIFPQYQRGGALGILTDSDQHDFLARAVDAVDGALADLGAAADRDHIVVAGHSLGGLLTLCWAEGGGAPASGLVMLNGSYTSDDVPEDVPLIPGAWEACAAATDAPALLLTGEDDGLSDESLLAFEALGSPSTGGVWLAHTDDHGDPALVAGHGAPLAAGTVDALDTRYHFAAVDAAVAGDFDPAFDMGAWSDGVPVTPVTRWAP